MTEGPDGEWRECSISPPDETLTFDADDVPSDDDLDDALRYFDKSMSDLLGTPTLDIAIGASEVASRAERLRKDLDPTASVIDPVMVEIRQKAAQELEEKSITATAQADIVYECGDCEAPRPVRVDEGDLITEDLKIGCWGVCETDTLHAITDRAVWDVAKVELVCPVCGYETLDWEDPGRPESHEDCPECLSEGSAGLSWRDVRDSDHGVAKLRDAADEMVRINNDVGWGNAINPSVSIRGFDPLSRGLTEVSGINGVTAQALGDAGYEFIGDLMAAEMEDLEDVNGFGRALSARVKSDVGDWPFDVGGVERIGKLRVADVWFAEGQSV